MVIYDRADIYISSTTALKEKITRLDAIITALEDKALEGVEQVNISEYTLNDGQTTIRTAYRSQEEILNAINGYIRMREHYVNKLNGRRIRLVDGKSFLRRG